MTDPKLGAGILVRTLQQAAADGPTPQKGDTVLVQYEGFLEDSPTQSFCSSKHCNNNDCPLPLSIIIGEDHVMEGWQIVLPHIRLNQRVEVTIPHLYAYGEQGYPPKIPSRSTLVFTMEIIQIDSSRRLARNKRTTWWWWWRWWFW